MWKLIKNLFVKEKLKTIKTIDELNIDLDSYRLYLYTCVRALKKVTYKNPHHIINMYIPLLEGEIDEDKVFHDQKRIEMYVNEINNLIK